MGCRPIGERQSLSIRPSRERVLASPRPSPRRSRWTLATALLAIALCGDFGWRYFHGADVGTGGLDAADGAPAPALIPVTVAQVKKADFPVYLNGLGAVEPYQTVLGAQPRRWRDHQNRLQARPDGQGRATSSRRSIRVPIRRRSIRRWRRRRRTRRRLKNAQLDLQRYAELAKEDSVSRQQLDTQQATVDQLIAQIKGDQAIDRQRPDASRLHDNPFADRGEDGLSPGRRRQHRPCRRHDGHRDDRAAAADLGRVHGA